MLEEDIDLLDDNDEEGEDGLFEHFRFITDKGQTLMRIDKFLMDRLPNATRNKIQKGIENKQILVDNKPVKSSYQIKPQEVITVSLPTPPRETEILPENIPLNIVYEDDSLLVINKEAGMVVHPACGNWTGTLVNALVYHFNQLPTARNGYGRPGLVHRIDKDTSGLLVIAKTEEAMTHLARQFFDHSIERTYYALVWGAVAEESGTIDKPLGRSVRDRRQSEVVADDCTYGKNAITHYKILKNLRYVTLLQCNLETGRTHQIRAHMRYLGHPLFNDAMYGGDRILKGTTNGKYKEYVENCFKLMPRQGLHAKSLGFVHPVTNEFMQFECDLPQDFKSCLEKWEHYVQYN